MYKPLGMFAAQTDELKKLIAEHPDYSIVVMCSYDVAGDDSWHWWYASRIGFEIGEILDCEQTIDDTRIYTDRDDFEDDVRNRLDFSGDYDDLSDEEFDAAVEEILSEYEPYWKNVIVIKADV